MTTAVPPEKMTPLEYYGQHKEPCRELTAETAKMFYKPRCICGLDDAIKAAKEAV